MVYKEPLYLLAVLMQSKDLKNEMSQVLYSFVARLKKKLEVISKRHREERYQVKRAEKDRDQLAETAVNKYYEVLSLRDIRQEWSPRPVTVKSVTSSLSSRHSYNPTLWPFSGAKNYLSPSVISSRKLPLGRKAGFNLPVTLEPEVRIIDETNL